MQTQGLSRDHVAALLALMHELHELPSVKRYAHVLQTLCRLTDSRCATLVRGNPAEVLETGKGMSALAHVGWNDPAELRALDHYFLNLDRYPNPLLAPVMASLIRQDGFFAAARSQVIDDATWYASPHVNDVRRSWGVDDSLCAAITVNADFYGITLYRSWGDRHRFEQYHVDMVAILLRELRWLFSDQSKDGSSQETELPPRLRKTLSLLLTGGSEKEIAGKLGLTRSTVHEYVKMIYRQCSVNSRAELMARHLKDTPEGTGAQRKAVAGAAVETAAV
jgi:DNA-binding CsgD family transcriptional regulator